MLRLLQKGNPAAGPSGSTEPADTWPPREMSHRITRTCDECGSGFFASASHMANLCPECAHHLYGYPACDHTLVAGRCETCGWDGSISPFVARLKAAKPRGN